MFHNSPLRRQIVLVTGGAILLFGLGAAEFVVRSETDAFERNFREQTEKLVRLLSATSLDAILSEDRPVLDTTIDSMVENDPDVAAVSIFTERGELLTSWERPGAQEVEDELVNFTQDVVLEGDSYGRFDVSWSVDRQHQEIAAAAQRVYMYAAGIAILLALLIVGLVDRLVVVPIRAIHNQLRRLEQGEDVPELQIRAARELANLGASVNELGQVLELRRAKELELEEVSRAKSELLANMSHELRTPMNGVLGMLALLDDSSLSHTQASQVRIAASSGRSLLRLINDILDFSKVESGKLEFESIVFDLERLVEETVEVVAEQAHSKGLELHASIDDSVRESHRGDPTRLRQVLTNLAGNAVKFTASGSVRIDVEPATHFGPPAPHRLRFSVTDTGVGIDADSQTKVFDSFSQADGSTTRTHGGTGLGLAISRQLIEGMGGVIGLSSAPGEGSTFWFELALPGEGLTVVERALGYAGSASGATALILDSSEGSAGTLAEQLQALGFECLQVCDGESAVAALRQAADDDRLPDVVFLAEMLDDMPGEVMARCIDADPAFDSIRLIAMNRIGSTSSTALDPDSDSRVSACLSKPVARTALLDLFAEDGQGHHHRDHGDRAVQRRQRVERNSGVRILVIEDNPVNQEVALGMLDKLGFQANVADNGQAGLDHLAEHPVDLVLMDCQMPVLDGYQTTQAIREREAEDGGARLPIIALTANAMQGDTEKCLAAGMDDYLAKPFDPERLEEKLDHWLKDVFAARVTQETADDEPVDGLATDDDTDTRRVA